MYGSQYWRIDLYKLKRTDRRQMESSMNRPVGNRVDDFYYKYNSKGSKYYYSRITNGRVAASDIPKSLISQIKSQDGQEIQFNLLSEKNRYLENIKNLEEHISKLKGKVYEIDLKLGQEAKIEGVSINEEKLRERKIREERRREQYQREVKIERKRLLEDLLRKDYNNWQSSDTTPSNILEDLKILTKKYWKEWLIINHPDKGGNSDICAKVITAGRLRGW